ncbi:hypothetical protein [Shewanella sp.]|uniref:hypothetical protein n=1 Tax=Shewanella sp. TaxID=50422 RepID=UPI001EBD0AC1|nr:hypothetical protein [Shewanella sp.]NRB23968.1 hypothetical protein [Shewanella sp.]
MTGLPPKPDAFSTPCAAAKSPMEKISFKPDTEAFRTQMQLLRLEGIEVNRGRISLTKFEWRPDMATLVLQLPF